MLELMNAHQLAVFGKADVTAEELRTWLTTPSVDVERDVRVLEQDGRLIGYVDADKTRNEPVRWWSDLKVAPDVDAAQVVPELLAWLEQRADEGLLRGLDERRRRASAPARTERTASTSLGTRTGWRSSSTARNASPSWPDGLHVRTFEPDDERRLYEVVVEVWQDTTEPIGEPFEEFRHWTTQREGFDPTLWFLVFDGDELAAFALDNPDDVDPDTGYVNLLGVRRAWRKQGLGEALLLHSFGAFRERGYTRATLGVDASSPTGATRLYERAGMRVYRDTVMLDRPVRRS